MTLSTNFLLLFSLLILSIKGYTQNYAPVSLGKEYLYSVPEGTLNNPNLWSYSSTDGPIGISVKNDTIISNKQIFFLNNQIRNSCDGPSALGQKVLIENDKFIFLNMPGDSIIFEPNKELDSEWALYTYADSSYLQAKIIDKQLIEFHNYPDSVKIISISYKDKNGNNQDHIYNNKTFILSKNIGFIKAYDLASFPYDTTSLILAGISSPALGIQNIKAKDIFNFDIGDEFHTSGKETYSIWAGSSHRYSEKILDKTASSDGDTVIYKIEKKHQYNNYTITSVLGNYTHDTITQKYIFSEFKHLELRPFEGFSNNSAGYSNIYSSNDTTYKIFRSYYHYQDSCYSPLIGQGIYDDFTYTVGRGLIAINGDQKNYSQVYYKKKNREWGTPIKFTLSNKEPIDQNSILQIIPNPASVYIVIKAKDNFYTGIVSITNTLGEEVLKEDLNPNSLETRLDLSSLRNGVYFIKIKNSQKELYSKILVSK